jgi:'Cold-shock' DNA-binding domain
VFVHIGAVERAGMRDLNEGQKISYEVSQKGARALVFAPAPPPNRETVGLQGRAERAEACDEPL